jgi:Holliday junction resolvasome RuvABC endonuclease subunit
MILSLDISSKRTGWAKFTKDGKLIEHGDIVPDPKIEPLNKLHYVVQEVEKLFGNVDELVIEDVFYQKNVKTLIYLSRIAGGVVYSWITKKYKIPYFYMAVTARKLAGANPRSHKSEIQLFICQKYNLISRNNFMFIFFLFISTNQIIFLAKLK